MAAALAGARGLACVERFGRGRRLRDRRQADELRIGRTVQLIRKFISAVIAAHQLFAAFVAMEDHRFALRLTDRLTLRDHAHIEHRRIFGLPRFHADGMCRRADRYAAGDTIRAARSEAEIHFLHGVVMDEVAHLAACARILQRDARHDAARREIGEQRIERRRRGAREVVDIHLQRNAIARAVPRSRCPRHCGSALRYRRLSFVRAPLRRLRPLSPRRRYRPNGTARGRSPASRCAESYRC